MTAKTRAAMVLGLTLICMGCLPQRRNSDPRPFSGGTGSKAPRPIQVSSPEEFVNAIGPDRVIHLAPGDYVLSDVKDRYMDYVRWDPGFDGKMPALEEMNVQRPTSNVQR